MGGVTFIPWVNQLGAMVREPGGVRIADGLRQARENLSSIKDSCLEGVDAQLTELERLCAEGGRQPSDEIKVNIYNISNDILAVAGAFELAELSQAAFCLCELVDRFRSLKRWNQAAVEVHLAAFRLLRNPNDGEVRSSVVDGLKRLVESVTSIAE